MNNSVFFSKGRMASLAGDFDLAESYYRKGVEIDDMRCIMALSGRLVDDRGSNYNLEESNNLIEYAASKNYAEAQNELGLKYQKGLDGYNQDINKAIEFYELAANQNYPEALRNLGILHFQGPTEILNEQKGLILLQKAAHMGHPPAFYTYALVLMETFFKYRDLSQKCPYDFCDEVEAIAWMKFAQMTGDKRANKNLFAYKVAALFRWSLRKKVKIRLNELLHSVEPYTPYDSII